MSYLGPAIADIRFDFDDDKRLSHNAGLDLHLFVLWPIAMKDKSIFRDEIARNFTICSQTTVDWDSSLAAGNIRRLYGLPPLGDQSKFNQVGAGPFDVIIAIDESPNYKYVVQNSGRLRPTNTRIIETKNRLRSRLGGDYLFPVHSSNSVDEFWKDGRFIFGRNLDRFISPTSAFPPTLPTYETKPPGAQGWSSIEDLLSFADLQTEYCLYKSRNLADVKRAIVSGKDIDVLVRNADHFVASIGGEFLHLKSGAPPQATCIVDGEQVLFDLRVIGDGCWDRRWQESNLRSCRSGETPGKYLTEIDWFFLRYYLTFAYKDLRNFHGLDELSDISYRLLDMEPDLANPRVSSAILDGYLRNSGFEWTNSKWNFEDLSENVSRFCDPDLLPSLASGVQGNIWRLIRRVRRRLGNTKRSLKNRMRREPS